MFTECTPKQAVTVLPASRDERGIHALLGPIGSAGAHLWDLQIAQSAPQVLQDNVKVLHAHSHVSGKSAVRGRHVAVAIVAL